MIGLEPAAWRDVLTAVAAASAALLGLFFVAFSLHLGEIEKHPVLRGRAALNVQALAVTFVLSISLLIPGQNNLVRGAEICAISIIYLLLLAVDTVQIYRSGGRLSRPTWLRLSANPVFIALAIACGVNLMVGEGPGLFLLIPWMLALVPLVVYNAWMVLFPKELRVRAAKQARHQADQRPN